MQDLRFLSIDEKYCDTYVYLYFTKITIVTNRQKLQKKSKKTWNIWVILFWSCLLLAPFASVQSCVESSKFIHLLYAVGLLNPLFCLGLDW